METLWFMIVAFMVAMYVVLDGFDLGAGIIHLFVARNREERRARRIPLQPVEPLHPHTLPRAKPFAMAYGLRGWKGVASVCGDSRTWPNISLEPAW